MFPRSSIFNFSGIALILTFSPREKEKQAHGSGFANERPTNPVACFCGGTVNVSPSPGLSRHSRQATAEGEGRGEVEFRRILSHTQDLPNTESSLARESVAC